MCYHIVIRIIFKENTMKRKLISTILLICMAIYACLFTSCGCSETDDNPTNEEITKTDEEIFSAVREAIANTAAYAGSYTVSGVVVSAHADSEKTTTLTNTTYASANPQESLYVYSHSRVDDSEITDLDFTKLYNDASIYYLYDNGKTTLASPDEFQELSKNFMLAPVPSEFTKTLVGFSMADSLSSLLNAYSSAKNSSLEDIRAELEAEETFNGDYCINVKYENGICYFIISCEIEQETNLGDMYGICSFNRSSVHTYSVKDGKLIGYEMLLTKKNNTTGSTKTLRGELNYTYSFDNDLFNSTAPEITPDSSENNSININFVFSDVISSTGYASSNSATSYELFNQAAINAQNSLNYDKNAISYDGWYLDKACTQKFDPNTITADQLKAIRKLYAKSFKINDGFVLIERINSKTYELSPLYQTACSTFWFEYLNSYSISNYIVARVGEALSLNTNCDEIRVNGVIYQENTLVPEEGINYKIEFKEIRKDSDINFFELLCDI